MLLVCGFGIGLVRWLSHRGGREIADGVEQEGDGDG
jgi:hypothetical protein